MKEIITRPGEVVVATEDSVIVCYALGSSLGICLYDSLNHIGGFVNSLLPKSNDNKLDMKYVDNAIIALYQHMLKQGSKCENILAKLIGGAQLFVLQNQDQEENNVGKANIKSAYQTLMNLNIPILSEDVGDTYGRTVYFHVVDGSVDIETSNKSIYQI